MSRILVYGKNGQVGWELQRSLGLISDVVFLSKEDPGGDLLNIDEVVARIKKEKPQIIFNAAAYTAVDAAENDFETARRVNGEAVGAIAKVCKELDITLVHYSTDYVFNGSGSKPWSEDDPIDPINAYGLTKALGERNIIESACRAYIFRTSWVFGVHGNNFLKTMLHLAASKKSLKVVSDQIGVPTSAEFVADISTYLAIHRPVKSAEVINLVPNGEVSWFDYAKFIFEQAKNRAVHIDPVLTINYPTTTKRPLNSRLNNTKVSALLPPGVVKDWHHYVLRILKELIEK